MRSNVLMPNCLLGPPIGGEFSPGQVPNMELWLRADLGITTVGTEVSDWADQSGNGVDFAQSVASARPNLIPNVINGLPVVRGDGVADFLVNSNRAVIASGARTVLTVFNPGPSVAVEAIICDGHRTGGTAGKIIILTPFTTVSAFGNTAQWAARAVSQFHVLTWSTATGNQIDWVLTEDGGAPIARTDVPGSTIHGILPAASLFCQMTDPTTPFGSFSDGDIAEILMYSRDLSAGEKTQIETYLIDRYDL